MTGWRHGLFECFSSPMNCVCVMCCPCFAYGNSWAKMGGSCPLCGLALFCPIVNCITHYMLRSKVRLEKHIEGTALVDVFSVWCCPCCSLIQIADEIDAPMQITRS